jgi:hypothetical protein
MMTFAECLRVCREIVGEGAIALEVLAWDGLANGQDGLRWGLWVSRKTKHVYGDTPELMIEYLRLLMAPEDHLPMATTMSADEVVL